MVDYYKSENERLMSVLVKVRDILLPLARDSNGPCGDMVVCTMSSIECVECLARTIGSESEKLRSRNMLLEEKGMRKDINGSVVMEDLFGECLAYQKFGQRIEPSHVKNMLKKAYEAGQN